VVAHRSRAALAAVTERRMIFASRRAPFRRGRLVEVWLAQIGDVASVEADVDERRLVLDAGATRITLQHITGRDAMGPIARSLGSKPDRETDRQVDGEEVPTPVPAQRLAPGVTLELVERGDVRDTNCTKTLGWWPRSIDPLVASSALRAPAVAGDSASATPDTAGSRWPRSSTPGGRRPPIAPAGRPAEPSHSKIASTGYAERSPARLGQLARVGHPAPDNPRHGLRNA
jgi:hypothetical protein